MHAYADMSHSLLFPEFTMSPDPESSLKFDHSSQGLLLGQISPLGCFVRQWDSLVSWRMRLKREGGSGSAFHLPCGPTIRETTEFS
jgi:hypothetical protein